MLMTLMYHRVRAKEFSDPAVYLKKNLEIFKNNYPLVVPGDRLSTKKLNICLSFDDAYFDFYHDVFPLLKSFEIKAVLAIPTHLIADAVNDNASSRLALSYNQPFNPHINHNPALCSWNEIVEMVDSGWIIPASHTASHSKLTEKGFNFEKEIIESKTLLENKTCQKVSTIVYPYGKVNKDIHQQVMQYYDYAMRIGTAINRNWHNHQSLIYRVDVNNYWENTERVTGNFSRLYHSLRYLSNRIRNK